MVDFFRCSRAISFDVDADCRLETESQSQERGHVDWEIGNLALRLDIFGVDHIDFPQSGTVLYHESVKGFVLGGSGGFHFHGYNPFLLYEDEVDFT